jgi:hypothetical protein
MTSVDPAWSTHSSGENRAVLAQMGILAELAGTWEGKGFNLITRPDFAGHQNHYLQLNQTRELLRVRPIGSPLPNRGFRETEMEPFGLHYLQEISDAVTGSDLYIEPGFWLTVPRATTYPDRDPPSGEQLVTRIGSIPGGNPFLAQGTAAPFIGPPVIAVGARPYAFSAFPSFNSTPFAVPPSPAAILFSAAGPSVDLTSRALGPPPAPIQEYDLNVVASRAIPPFPYSTGPIDLPLPDPLDGVALQEVVNDPITLLQAVVQKQIADGYTFEGVVLNVATRASIKSLDHQNDPTGQKTTVDVSEAASGIEKAQFLEECDPRGAQDPDADTGLIYSTFWIEELSHPTLPSFVQLQYAQMVVLDFGVFTVLDPPAPEPLGSGRLVLLGWPRITVGTLRKSFS